MSSSAPIGFLVMAAGHGRRFGGCKLTAPFSAEHTVLGRVLDLIAPVQAPICVVTSENKVAVLKLVQQKGIDVVAMPEDSAGLGESITYGVDATKHWGGWILCLGDMPWISTDIYQQVWLRACANEAKQIAPRVLERRGHPVFFDKQYAKALCGLTGDTGAVSVIDTNILATFAVASYSLFKDVDRPADLIPCDDL